MLIISAHHIEHKNSKEDEGRGAGDELKRGEGRQQAVEARHDERHQQISTCKESRRRQRRTMPLIRRAGRDRDKTTASLSFNYRVQRRYIQSYSHERRRVFELGGQGEDEPRELRHRDAHRLLGGGQHDEPRQRHREQEHPQGQVGAGEAPARRRGRRRAFAGLRRGGVRGGHGSRSLAS